MIEQTIDIPVSRQVSLKLPLDLPAGKARIIVFSQTERSDKTIDDCVYEDCPLHAENPPLNAKVRAAIEESKAIMRGDIPAKWYNSLEDAQKDEENVKITFSFTGTHSDFL